MMGTAYLIQGQYQPATDFLGDGLGAWRMSFVELSPARKKNLLEVWKWTDHDFEWYGRCEKALRRLALLRLREFPKGQSLTFTNGFSKALEKIDGLFPETAKPGDAPVRFVGESGKFEPGKLAAAEMPRQASQGCHRSRSAAADLDAR